MKGFYQMPLREKKEREVLKTEPLKKKAEPAKAQETLEEPKESVIFILATTEPHKIPATIISRTQRFDFKRINTADIVEHLEFILKESTISYEPAAFECDCPVLQKAGCRGCIGGILDQAISFSEGTITLDDAMQVTGSLTDEMMDSYLSACVKKESTRSIGSVESNSRSRQKNHVAF